MKSFRHLATASAAFLLGVNSAFAASAVWDFAPGTNDWNTAVNWTPDTVPNGSGDTATFAVSGVTAIALSAETEVNGIAFNVGASAYTITATPDVSLTLSGTGISNLSGSLQRFVATANGVLSGGFAFTNSATAGTLTSFTTSGGTNSFSGGGIAFFNTSNAGSATFTNNAGTVAGAFGGFTEFFGSSSASTATIINNGASVDAAGGLTIFSDHSTAANAHVTNNAGTMANTDGGVTQFDTNATAANGVFTNNGAQITLAGHGETSFSDFSTAGSATFNNTGGGANNTNGGATNFFDTSTAANGTFINNGGTASGADGGKTEFADSSTAANGFFTNNGGTSGGAGGGVVVFTDTSTAGNGTFTTNAGLASGAEGGVIEFNDNSTAANGTFATNGAKIAGAGHGQMSFTNSATAGNGTFITTGATVLGTEGGLIEFHNMSTAGSGTFTNNGATNAGGGGAEIKFFDTANAGSASFANHAGTIAGAGAGRVDFFNNAKAGTASFTNDGGALPGAIPSVTDFHDTSSADQSSITSNGGTAAGAAGGQVDFVNSSKAGSATLTANAGTVAGAFGAFTVFFDTSAANSATLIANGGLGQGGGIYFFDQSTGDTSRVEVFGNGFLDISGHNLPGVTIGSIEGSGNAFLGANNLTVGSNNLSTTFSGVMQDGGDSGGTGGSLTKIGPGTLTLTGANTYTGATTVNGGSLIVDGSTTSPSTTVNAGGLLGGNGTIGGFISNGGIVSPGHSAGTLTGNGSYVQTAAGTLRIEIGGVLPAQHDLLQVAGGAGLDGTLQLLRLNNFQPMNGDQVIVLTWGAARNGQFSSVTDDFQGLIRPHIIYDPNDVRVVFALVNSFASQALTPNQQAVGANLDDAANDPAAAALIAFLGARLPGNLPHDFDLIAPEELAAIYEVGFSQAMVQNSNLERRMDDIRAGSNGFCANNFVATTSGKDFSKDAGGKVVLPAKDGPEVYIPTENNRWGVFVNGSGNFVNVGDDDFNAPGYEITTGNFTFGADYRVSDHFAIGINGGYANSQADLVNDGRIDVDGGKIGAYATVFGKGFFGGKIYIDGAIGGGLNNYDTLRIGLQNELVRGDTDGSEFNGMISYGSDWTFGCFNIGTWSTIQYTRVNIDEFTELGSLAPLEIQDQAEDSLRSTTGIRASYNIKAGRALIRPELRVAWQHEHGDRGYQVDSRFASGAGGIFRVHGPEVGKDAALIGAGLNMQWCNRFSTYVYYDGVLGRSNYDNSAVTGGLRVGF